jgi:hypothetical protein
MAGQARVQRRRQEQPDKEGLHTSSQPDLSQAKARSQGTPIAFLGLSFPISVLRGSDLITAVHLTHRSLGEGEAAGGAPAHSQLLLATLTCTGFELQASHL